MKVKHFIFLFFILVAHYSTATAQLVADKELKQTNTDTIDVEHYRKLFSDSLPKPYSWTNDYAWLYSTAQRNYLDSTIADFEKRTTVEICIVTLDTFCISDENFDALALKIATTWGVGKKETNNGVVICISPGYRKIRVCNGFGIEKYLSDAETKKIIDDTILSQFKEGNYFSGTVAGLIAIMGKLSPFYSPSQNHSPGN